jgi:hypothetical protein
VTKDKIFFVGLAVGLKWVEIGYTKRRVQRTVEQLRNCFTVNEQLL